MKSIHFGSLSGMLRGFLLLAISFCFASTTNHLSATEYFVDSLIGNDANPGHELSPWKTIEKVNNTALNPGDIVRLKRGSFWREGLIIKSDSITVDAYGPGSTLPVLSGAVLIPSIAWSLHQGNIYVAEVGNIAQPTQIYVDDVLCELARDPDVGYNTVTDNSPNNTTFIDSNQTHTRWAFEGATLLARSNNWSVDTLRISHYDEATHTITTIDPLVSKTMKAGWGYVLRNKLWMLNRPGEWYYDPSDRKLYLWTPTNDSPANHTVEVSQISNVVESSGNSNVTIRNLKIIRGNSHNVHITDGTTSYEPTKSGNRVNNLVLEGGNLGLFFKSKNSEVRDNVIVDTLWCGLFFQGPDNTISNNRINNAGNMGIPAMLNGDPQYIGSDNPLNLGGLGIFTRGVNRSVISGNEVRNSGYVGIRATGENLLVANNTVDISVRS